jgi:hypothetical protein
VIDPLLPVKLMPECRGKKIAEVTPEWELVLSFGAAVGGAAGWGFFLNMPFILRKTLLEVLSARFKASLVTELDFPTAFCEDACLILAGMFLMESPTWAAHLVEQ